MATRGGVAGWFRVPRGWGDDACFKPEPFTEREAYLWSIENAAYEAHARWFNGQQVQLARGQIVTSVRDLASRFGWTEKRIRGFMERLVKAGKWAHLPTKGYCIISVRDYAKSQSDEGGEGTPKGTRGAQQGHSEGTQDKKGKKGEEGKEGIGVAKATPLSAQAVEFWNEAAQSADWPGIAKLTDKRRDKLKLRFDEIGGLAAWKAAITRALQSPLLNPKRGKSPTWFTFDWLVANDTNLTKLMEGNYDREFSRGGRESSGLGKTGAAIARLNDRLEGGAGEGQLARLPFHPRSRSRPAAPSAGGNSGGAATGDPE